MKTERKKSKQDELRPQCDFAAMKAKPNRFVGKSREQMVVLLDSDLAKVFRTPEEVQHALRALVDAIPQRRRKAA